MQISDLNQSLQFGADDVLAIEINDVTYKLTGANLATALKTLGNYINGNEVPSGVSLDDIKYGFYGYAAGRSLSGWTQSGGVFYGGVLTVSNGASGTNNRTTQILHEVFSNTMYMRKYSGSEWSALEKISVEKSPGAVSGVTISSSDNRISLTSANVYKWGPVVNVYLTFSVNGSSTAWASGYGGRIELTVNNIPRPISTQTFYCNLGTSGAGLMTLWSGRNADIRQFSGSGIGSTISFSVSATYLTND